MLCVRTQNQSAGERRFANALIGCENAMRGEKFAVLFLRVCLFTTSAVLTQIYVGLKGKNDREQG